MLAVAIDLTSACGVLHQIGGVFVLGPGNTCDFMFRSAFVGDIPDMLEVSKDAHAYVFIRFMLERPLKIPAAAAGLRGGDRCGSQVGGAGGVPTGPAVEHASEAGLQNGPSCA